MMDMLLHSKEYCKGFREKARKPRGPGKAHVGSSQPNKVRDREEKREDLHIFESALGEVSRPYSTSLQFIGSPLQGGNPGKESSALL